MDEIRSVEINKGINLHVLNTDKFKTSTMSIYFHNNIDKDASFNALLPSVLKRGSSSFPNSTVINEFLENMYGAVFESDILKKGEIQSILFYFQFISNRYVGGEDILSKVTDFAGDIILNPLVEDKGFNREYVKTESENLKKRIASRINDKVQYPVERCMEIMCEGEPYAIYKYGDADSIGDINEKNLYDHYRRILVSSPIDIFIVGDLEQMDPAGLLREKFNIKGRNPVKLKGFNIGQFKGEPKEVMESMDVNQGKLCLGYRTRITFAEDMYPALSVYTSILGGGMHSKLFQNVRERESLAYYIYCGLEKFKALMVINSGIELSNYDKAVEIIKQQVDEMAKGNISDFEMDSSIKKIVSDLKSVEDNVPLMIDYNLGGFLYNHPIDIEKNIKEIENVKKDQVIEVAQKIRLDTVYFLKSHDKER